MKQGAKIIELLRDGRGARSERTNERGNLIREAFAGRDRYLWDFDKDFTADGWQQYDTDQDAHYFGMWVNPKRLETFTYCEGDVELVICSDVEHYNAEIANANEFYGEGFEFIAYDLDAKTRTEYRQDRAQFVA